MDPDFGLGIGQDKPLGTAPRPRPSLIVRGLELAGLVLVIYGLGSYRFGLVAIGGVAIVGSYALYRRTHGPDLNPGPGRGRDGFDGQEPDGGGELAPTRR
jgi:hypothetical protein